MKNIFVIFITLGILLQSFSKVVIWVDFELNREYISKNLCVQKAKKNNTCKGTCQLKKKLEEDDKEEKSPAGSLKELKEFQIFCQKGVSFDFKVTAQQINKFLLPSGPGTNSVSHSIFHPPKA